MSEVKNLGWTWMALNTFKRNYLTPLHFKGLKHDSCQLMALAARSACVEMRISFDRSSDSSSRSLTNNARNSKMRFAI